MSQTILINIELKDSLFKAQLYLQKIIGTNGSFAQIQKICHLTVQTCLKFSQKEAFSHQLFNKIQILIKQTRNYFLLYLLDLLIKNSLPMMKIAKKDIQSLFKLVWQSIWLESKNTTKIQCMKAMAKTWGIIYGEYIQENIKTWLMQKYKVSLVLQKYQELYNQIAQTHRNSRKAQFLKVEHEPTISDSDKKSVKIIDISAFRI